MSKLKDLQDLFECKDIPYYVYINCRVVIPKLSKEQYFWAKSIANGVD